MHNLPQAYYRKATWIANKLDESCDDVYDVLIGNIQTPKEFVDRVIKLSENWDNDFLRHNRSN